MSTGATDVQMLWEFLIEFKVHPASWNLYLASFSEITWREVIGHGKESSTIVLLNGQVLNHLLSNYCYANRLVYLSTPIREASFYSKWWLTETHNRSMYREYEPVRLCLNRTSDHTLSFQDSGIFAKEGAERLKYKPEVADDWTMFSRHNRATAHLSNMNPTVGDSLQHKTCLSSCQTKFQHGEWKVDTTFHHSWEAISIWQLLGGESVFFKYVTPWRLVPQSKERWREKMRLSG